jgi:hypothetical protein
MTSVPGHTGLAIKKLLPTGFWIPKQRMIENDFKRMLTAASRCPVYQYVALPLALDVAAFSYSAFQLHNIDCFEQNAPCM